MLPMWKNKKSQNSLWLPFEMIVHYLEKISTINHSSDFLVYRLFVNSVEVNRLVLRLVEFQIFYKHIKVDTIDS